MIPQRVFALFLFFSLLDGDSSLQTKNGGLNGVQKGSSTLAATQKAACDLLRGSENGNQKTERDDNKPNFHSSPRSGSATRWGLQVF